jgi:DNA-binding PadR family transcriptional regulator
MRARPLTFPAVTVLHAIASGVPYGFEILDATRLPSGTVYPILGRLERDGYVRSAWENARTAQDEKRPRRRYYRITAHGEKVLNESLTRFRALEPVPPMAPARGRG